MPRKPFEAEVIRVYEPDRKCEVQGIKKFVDWLRREKAGVVSVSDTKKPS